MTQEEFEQHKRRLDEQLEAGIGMLRDGHRAQVRALEAAWAASRQEPAEPAAPTVPAPEKTRRGSLEVYDEVLAVLDRLPAEFDKNEVCRALGYSPGRVPLFRALRKLEEEGHVKPMEYGAGRRTTVYRWTGSRGAVSGGG